MDSFDDRGWQSRLSPAGRRRPSATSTIRLPVPSSCRCSWPTSAGFIATSSCCFPRNRTPTTCCRRRRWCLRGIRRVPGRCGRNFYYLGLQDPAASVGLGVSPPQGARAPLDEDVLELFAQLSTRDESILEVRSAALEQCLGKLTFGDRQLIERCYADQLKGRELALELPARKINLPFPGAARRTLIECVRRFLASAERRSLVNLSYHDAAS